MSDSEIIETHMRAFLVRMREIGEQARQCTVEICKANAKSIMENGLDPLTYGADEKKMEQLEAKIAAIKGLPV